MKTKAMVNAHEPAPGDQKPMLQQRVRIYTVLSFLLTFFAVITVRLWQVHLSPSNELTDEEKKHIGEVELLEPRGEIVDRNGLVLATNRDTPSLCADPRYIQDAPMLALAISARLGMDENEVFQLLTKRNAKGKLLKFVWVKRWLFDVPDEVLQEITDLSNGAVYVKNESLRYYPQGDTAAHLLGFVNRAGEASEGAELAFDRHLASRPGKLLARKDVQRRLLPSLTLEHVEPEGGEELHLTIDSGMQHTLEQEIDKRMVECNAPRGMGILMDPKTGGILALACRPAFDPNLYDEYEPELRKNRALTDVFEPGSSFKIVTASAVLEHSLVQLDEMIDCENGSFNPYGHRITDFHKYGVIPFSRCFEESSNIAMIKVAARLGEERLDQWIRRFGFGQPTCSQFPLESRGIYRPRSEWSRLSMGSLPMGQEIAVTMLQLARAFAIIANGGLAVTPHYADKAVSRVGEVTWRYQHESPQRILSPTTAKTMQQLCHQVVLHGTGEAASIPEYRVGGKTGTAQMANADGRGYSADRYTCVFAGFAPVADPRIVCVIVIQEPMIRLHYGGYVCGPVFKRVVRDALIRMNVAADPVLEELSPVEPINEDADTAGSRLAPELLAKAVEPLAMREEAPPILLLDPVALDESLDALLEPLDSLELTDRVAGAAIGGPLLPDLTGMTKSEVRSCLMELDVAWDPRGAGWVVEQFPPPGTPLSEVGMCAVRFGTQPAEPVNDPESDIQLSKSN